ncbi:MAG: triose-phosphate isomerase [Nitrosopumilus sp. B06]|nr:MAG: triose-phosphate isomerase [Nitrosopumilus sp. D6]RNJ80542.1 MAG: triose-phosphate isomerase [Nitrosopumilus sp. B06]
MFVINCKNYQEVTGEEITKFLRIAHKIAKKYKVKIAVAPPQHLLGVAAKNPGMILAQHVDIHCVGSTTGFVIPELLKKSKVAGSLINHSEHRIPGSEIKKLVIRLRKLKMISIVCVKDTAEAKKYARLDPDYIAIEPPELIGSGKAVSRHRPDLITKAATAIKAGKGTRLLCGAGITSGEDVAVALRLGSKGVLVASGIVKSKNWEKTIAEFASSMV